MKSLDLKKKNGFVSGLGFVFASAGSAVGLGNICAFPYKVGANGGAAFVFVYLICVVIIGAVAMIAEIYIGKRANANVLTSYKKIHKNFGFAGMIAITIPLLIACYYSVFGGWTLRYAVNSFQTSPTLNNVASGATFASNAFSPVIFTLIFICLAIGIIVAGVKNGIEKTSKILMPILFVLLISIAIFALCLGDGVKEGLNYYLNPDFSALGFDGIISAMGQAFFSLSIGMGSMICYGSYTGKEIKMGKSVAMICFFDTMVALLAGIIVFPAIGALGGSFEQNYGFDLIFSILPQLFAKMGGIGVAVSFLFFAMVVIAAITSVISLFEVVTQFVIQNFKISRLKSTMILLPISLVISVPLTWSFGNAFGGAIKLFGFDLVTIIDEMVNLIFMPLGALFACVSLGWFIGKKPAGKSLLNPKTTYLMLKEDGLDLGGIIGKIFAVMVKYIAPCLILVVEVFGIIEKAKSPTANYLPIFIIGLSIFALLTVVYFVWLKNKDNGNNDLEYELNKPKES